MVAPTFFQREPVTARAALSAVKDSSDMLRFLLDSGKTVKAVADNSKADKINKISNNSIDEASGIKSLSGHLQKTFSTWKETVEYLIRYKDYAYVA